MPRLGTACSSSLTKPSGYAVRGATCDASGSVHVVRVEIFYCPV